MEMIGLNRPFLSSAAIYAVKTAARVPSLRRIFKMPLRTLLKPRFICEMLDLAHKSVKIRLQQGVRGDWG